MSQPDWLQLWIHGRPNEEKGSQLQGSGLRWDIPDSQDRRTNKTYLAIAHALSDLSSSFMIWLDDQKSVKNSWIFDPRTEEIGLISR